MPIAGKRMGRLDGVGGRCSMLMLAA